MPDRDSVAVEVGQPGDRNSSIEGFSVTSALWRLKDRRFTPDKYTHKPKSLGVFLEVTLEPWGISRALGVFLEVTLEPWFTSFLIGHTIS